MSKPKKAGNLLTQGAEIGDAIRDLQRARDALRRAGASKAADYVARCLKSAEGARRHNMRLRSEAGIYNDNGRI